MCMTPGKKSLNGNTARKSRRARPYRATAQWKEGGVTSAGYMPHPNPVFSSTQRWMWAEKNTRNDDSATASCLVRIVCSMGVFMKCAAKTNALCESVQCASPHRLGRSNHKWGIDIDLTGGGSDFSLISSQ